MYSGFINLPEHIKRIEHNMQNVAVGNLLNIKHMRFVHTAIKKTSLNVHCLDQFCATTNIIISWGTSN